MHNCGVNHLKWTGKTDAQDVVHGTNRAPQGPACTHSLYSCLRVKFKHFLSTFKNLRTLKTCIITSKLTSNKYDERIVSFQIRNIFGLNEQLCRWNIWQCWKLSIFQGTCTNLSTFLALKTVRNQAFSKSSRFCKNCAARCNRSWSI